MKRYVLLTEIAALALGACSTGGASPEVADQGPPPPMSVSAEIREPGGRIVARGTAEQAGDSVRVRVEAAGLAPGAYGVHLHSAGRCDPPGFTTAGPHWNPAGRQHGKDNPQGMHLGDLPNLLVGTDGRGSFEYTVAGASVGGDRPSAMLDVDGTALVIHAQPDDFRTDPSGNSGARIACGVLR